jgi:hypothetical protein
VPDIIAEALAEVFRREMTDAEFSITPVPLPKAEQGYAYKTVRRGRIGLVTVGANLTKDLGFSAATEAAAETLLREQCVLGAKV